MRLFFGGGALSWSCVALFLLRGTAVGASCSRAKHPLFLVYHYYAGLPVFLSFHLT
ncbi:MULTISPECIES: hypothetical protein [unclassified Okeania]|uniref:hypothetical protein n=1 Tax=unclassified Okeania TaxID=2634635 RepID=UPI0013B66142|nr:MULTISPECIES: hypothetical protein [unclassified Okeania]NEP73924.1 hypothetical protein [Okeania sp. SIO2G5]NEP94738.1 hypothetical protein [Okeania sp. SIO2F5]